MNFFFNDTATTEIYTLSLHDALPIYLKFEIHTELSTIRLKTQQLLIDQPNSWEHSSIHKIHIVGLSLRPADNGGVEYTLQVTLNFLYLGPCFPNTT